MLPTLFQRLLLVERLDTQPFLPCSDFTESSIGFEYALNNHHFDERFVLVTRCSLDQALDWSLVCAYAAQNAVEYTPLCST